MVKKVLQKRVHAHYSLDGHSRINHWDFVTFEQSETHD